jgi:hypothetical protein
MWMCHQLLAAGGGLVAGLAGGIALTVAYAKVTGQHFRWVGWTHGRRPQP